MYLLGESLLYTSRGYESIQDLAPEGYRKEILLVGCCDIIGNVYWSLTKISIEQIDVNTHNVSVFRRIESDGNLTLINGLINTFYGWNAPLADTEHSRIITFEDGSNKPEIVLNTVEISPIKVSLKKLDNIYRVQGLPIGVVVDDLSIYPIDVTSSTYDMLPDKNYTFRRQNIPFQFPSEELERLEQEMIEKLGTVESIHSKPDEMPSDLSEENSDYDTDDVEAFDLD